VKTYSAKVNEVEQAWHLVDAANKPLGRLASEIAKRLRGKHKPEYTPHTDTGDYIVVINARAIRVTGNKAKDKFYHRHSGYPGGLRSMNFETMIARFPERVIEIAVKGMLPKGPLGRDMYRKLKVYAGSEHKHHAQNPQVLNLLSEER
jgi:large subunit ribosomal protein L13